MRYLEVLRWFPISLVTAQQWNRMSKEHVGKLSKYKIKKQIGKGSYGTVFLVDCRESKKQVSGCQVIV